MHSVEDVAERFRSMGRKVTPQRMCVWRAIAGDTAHPTAETIHARVRADMETVSLKTVYQILHELEELGEIEALDVGAGALRFDPNVDVGHHHAVCTSCLKVLDIFADVPGLQPPPGAHAGLAGFEIAKAEVIFRGICAECRAAGSGAQEGAERSLNQREQEESGEGKETGVRHGASR